MAPPKPRPEENNLASEQFAELNGQFYRAQMQPHAYLQARFRSLVLGVQRPEQLPGAFDVEFDVGDLKSKWSSQGEWDELEVRDYLSTESTVLLHHATEALFRLYFAHADNPECPWLGVARLRLPSQFKDRLSRFMDDSGTLETAESVMNVLIGHPSPGEGNADLWNNVRTGAMLLLRHLGGRLQEEGPLYNSAKHGLALVPGAAALAFGNQSGPYPIRADGPSITYLTVKPGKNGKRWAQETVWLDAELNLALTHLVICQIANLWHVARHRYTGDAWDESQMRYIGSDLVDAVLNKRANDAGGVVVTVPSMSMELLYYAPEDSVAPEQ